MLRNRTALHIVPSIDRYDCSVKDRRVKSLPTLSKHTRLR